MAEDQVKDDYEDRSLVQHSSGLTWDLCNRPVSDAIIVEHERILGVTFPEDFRAVIQQCPGGHPVERCDFWIDHPGYGRMGSGLGGLVTLGPADDDDSMLACSEALHERFCVSRQLIPIALDGGGDFMCLDYRDSELAPDVVYWSYGAIPKVAIAYIADSFTSFLALLKPPDTPDDMIRSRRQK